MNVTTATPGTPPPTALAVVEQHQINAYTPEDFQSLVRQVETLQELICKGANYDQLIMFCKVAARSGLDPFMKQIYGIIRDGKMTIQVGIDGLRLIAENSGLYDGQVGPFWCGPDGVWKDVWLDQENPPSAAKVGVRKAGCTEIFWGIARYTSYVQKSGKGEVTKIWKQMPDVMLEKCAEAKALRKAFPAKSQGLYTDDEMGQADNDYTPDPAHEAEKREWALQKERLFGAAAKHWPDKNETQRAAIVAKFCEKRGFLARFDSGQLNLNGSSVDQIREAANALEAWKPEQAQSEQAPQEEEVHEAEFSTPAQEKAAAEFEKIYYEILDSIDEFEVTLSGTNVPTALAAWRRGELETALKESRLPADVFAKPDHPYNIGDFTTWTSNMLTLWRDYLATVSSEPKTW